MSWLNKVFGKRVSNPIKKVKPSVLLRLEALEDRYAPATLGAGNADPSTAISGNIKNNNNTFTLITSQGITGTLAGGTITSITGKVNGIVGNVYTCDITYSGSLSDGSTFSGTAAGGGSITVASGNATGYVNISTTTNTGKFLHIYGTVLGTVSGINNTLSGSVDCTIINESTGSYTIWDPTAGTNWNNVANWTQGIPAAGKVAVFNKNNSASSCQVDVSTAEDAVILLNDYAGTFDIQPGKHFTINYLFDDWGDSTQALNITFHTPGPLQMVGTLSFNSGYNLMGNFSIGTGGTATFSNIDTAIGYRGGLSCSIVSSTHISSGSSMLVGQGANRPGASTLSVNNDINAAAGSVMQIYQPLVSATVISANANTTVINNSGTIYLMNPIGATTSTATLYIPIENSGGLSIGGTQGGGAVAGNWSCTLADTNVFEINNTGNLTMTNGTTLTCGDNFHQGSGTFVVSGNTTCSLSAGSGGDVQFSGGSITFNSATGYGGLYISSGDLTLHDTTVNMRLDGNNTNSDDFIRTGGASNNIIIGGTSAIVVTNTGSGKTSGKSWNLLTSQNTISNDFPSVTLPAGGGFMEDALTTTWKCHAN